MTYIQPSVEELARGKAECDKNKFYIHLKEDMNKELKRIRKHVGEMRSAQLDQIRLEQGKLDGIAWSIARPDKLMDKLIKESLEE